MRIRYNGVTLQVNFTDSYHRSLMKSSVKRLLNRIGVRGENIFWKTETDAFKVSGDIISNEKNPIIVDIGCNIGAFSLPIAKKFPNAKVFAVDAHPIAGAGYVYNMWQNKLENIIFISAAIAPKSNDLIEIFSCSTNSGGHRVTGYAGREDLYNNLLKRHIYVPSIRLDEIKLFTDKITLLKVDVEGYEYQVLSSLGDLLNTNYVHAVIAEYGPEGMRAAGHSGADLLALMDKVGYYCIDLSSNKTIATSTDIPELPDFSATDFLFLPKGNKL